MMRFVENMLEEVAKAVNGTTKAVIGEKSVDFNLYAQYLSLSRLKNMLALTLTARLESKYATAVDSLDVDETMGKANLSMRFWWKWSIIMFKLPISLIIL